MFSLKTFPTIAKHSFYRDLPDHSDPQHPYRVRLDSSLLIDRGRYVYGILQTGMEMFVFNLIVFVALHSVFTVNILAMKIL